MLNHRDTDSKSSKIAHSGRDRGRVGCGSGWATGVHMTKFSTDRAQAHGASALGMSGGSLLTEGADVFRTLGAYVFQGLALEAVSDSRSSWEFRGVRDCDGVAAGSGLHNHLQSSREHNMSSVHSRSTSSANSPPTSLSQSRVSMVSHSGCEGGSGSRTSGKGIGLSGQLGSRIYSCVSRGEGIGGRGFPLWLRGTGIDGPGWECSIHRLLQYLLCHLVTTIVSSALLLRKGEENSAENVGEVVPGESCQELVESSVHQQDKCGSLGSRQGGVKGLGDLYR